MSDVEQLFLDLAESVVPQALGVLAVAGVSRAESGIVLDSIREEVLSLPFSVGWYRVLWAQGVVRGDLSNFGALVESAQMLMTSRVGKGLEIRAVFDPQVGEDPTLSFDAMQKELSSTRNFGEFCSNGVIRVVDGKLWEAEEK